MLRLLSLLLLAAFLTPSQNLPLPLPRRKKTASGPTQAQKERLRVIEGKLRRNDPAAIVLEPKDHRLLHFIATPQTKFVADDGTPKKAVDIQPGDDVAIDFYEDDDRNMYAAKVMQMRQGTDAERAAAGAPLNEGPERMDSTERKAEDGPPVFRRGGGGSGGDGPPVMRRTGPGSEGSAPAPTSASAPVAAPAPAEEAAEGPVGPTTSVYVPQDDPDKPRLRRGPPPKRASPPPPEPVVLAEAKAPVAPGKAAAPVAAPRSPEPDPDLTPRKEVSLGPEKIMDPIERAKAVHAQLDLTLPNYTALQVTTRFESSTPKANWQAKDTVTADVFYENGSEQYRNVKVNGKASKGKAEEGNWSIGEFATVTNDIFRSALDDAFYLLRKETFNGRETTLHSFRVEQGNSNWLLKMQTQSFRPAYRGRLWIDKETGRVLRLEMQAEKLPQDFPLDVAELSAEAEFVRLGTATYLLPVRSEVLTCFRGTSNCARNQIEFRNYKKFGAESTIVFEVK